jgi:hypothetical protein
MRNGIGNNFSLENDDYHHIEINKFPMLKHSN